MTNDRENLAREVLDEVCPDVAWFTPEARNGAIRAMLTFATRLPSLGVDDGVREAAQGLIERMSSTYRARNGREVGIQGDDGEKCWIVHSEDITALEAALNGPLVHSGVVSEAAARIRERVDIWSNDSSLKRDITLVISSLPQAQIARRGLEKIAEFKPIEGGGDAHTQIATFAFQIARKSLAALTPANKQGGV